MKDFFSKSYGLKNSQDTKEHYKQWADSYDEEIDKQSHYAQPRRLATCLQKLNIAKNAKIFDAGCGSGLSGLAMQKAGYENIIGADFSKQMLEKATMKKCYKSLHEIDLNKKLKIENAIYDVVTAVGVFSFGHIDPQACHELLRILKPNGYFIIALNEKYWKSGQLKEKITQLEKQNKIKITIQEYGEHMPKQKIMGWVIALKKL